MAKLMAFLFFLSSCVTAFCLALMSFTLVTGELPFGMEPVVEESKQPPPGEGVEIEGEGQGKAKEAEQDKTRTIVLTEEEISTLESLSEKDRGLHLIFSALEQKRERLEEDRKAIEKKEQVAEELLRNARKVQESLEKKEEAIRGLLETIDETERKNAKRLAEWVANAEPVASSRMLLEMEKKLASRVLYYMENRNTSEIINQMMSAKDPEKVKRATKIVEQARMLVEQEELDI